MSKISIATGYLRSFFSKGIILNINLFLLILAGVVFVLGILLLLVQFERKTTCSETSTPTQVSKTPINAIEEHRSEKTSYNNDYYNFKIDIPAGWHINSKGQHFQILSENYLILIQDDPVFRDACGLKIQEILHNPVQIGKYEGLRTRKIKNSGLIDDYITLPPNNRQKTLTFYLAINGSFMENNDQVLQILKTFAWTREEPFIEELFNYSLPSGWVKDERFSQSQERIGFISADAKRATDGVPYLEQGAEIYVTRNISGDTLAEIIENTENNERTNIVAEFNKIKIDGNETLNIFSCYEGCSDGYIAIKNGFQWSILFSCNNCSTKSKADSSIYAKDRDTFLSSLKIK